MTQRAQQAYLHVVGLVMLVFKRWTSKGSRIFMLN
jgi:hypothetical protein